MRNVKVSEIAGAVGGRLISGYPDILINDICIDSRVAKEGDIFVPLKGENADGHKFIKSAMEKASATFTAEDIEIPDDGDSRKAYIKVDDTLEALQTLGEYFRKKYTKKVVGVTGSVGKTTTREMITCALEAEGKVYHTEKNFNSEIGTPITLSKMNDAASDIAVLELGISHDGEMDVLSRIAKPDIAVVTMIGVAHMEFFKTKENIRNEKLKIISSMDENGVLFLNGNDELLYEVRNSMPVTTKTFGIGDGFDYCAKNLRMENGLSTFEFVYDDKEVTVRLKQAGKHFVSDSLAALSICAFLSRNVEAAAKKLADFAGQRQRLTKAACGAVVIDDTYNASPDSMKAATDVLSDMECSGKKYILLGDMFELGDNADEFHASVGDYMEGKDVDVLLTIGEMSKNIADHAAKANPSLEIKEYRREDMEKLTGYLKEILTPDDIILIKASNGMHLKEIVEQLEKDADSE